MNTVIMFCLLLSMISGYPVNELSFLGHIFQNEVPMKIPRIPPPRFLNPIEKHYEEIQFNEILPNSKKILDLDSLPKQHPPIEHLVTDPLIGPDFPSHFQAIRYLGEGTFGRTFLVRDVSRPLTPLFVVKVFKGFGSNAAMVKNEWEILNSKAVNLGYGDVIVDQFTGKTFLPMKYVKGERFYDRFKRDIQARILQTPADQLNNRIVSKSDKPLTESQTNQIIFQLTKDIDKLHNAGIVHRDLATRNIILSDDLKPTIIDYGRAKYSKSEKLFLEDISFFVSNVPRKNMLKVMEMRKKDPTLSNQLWNTMFD